MLVNGIAGRRGLKRGAGWDKGAGGNGSQSARGREGVGGKRGKRRKVRGETRLVLLLGGHVLSTLSNEPVLSARATLYATVRTLARCGTGL